VEAKTLDFHHSTSLRIRQCRLYLLEKGHQVDSITDTNVGDPNIGTSTFIVTNDTAVNSPLTPSRVGSNKQERTCSPLLPSASSTLPSVFFFFYTTVVSIDKRSRLFGINNGELSQLEFGASIASSYVSEILVD